MNLKTKKIFAREFIIFCSIILLAITSLLVFILINLGKDIAYGKNAVRLEEIETELSRIPTNYDDDLYLKLWDFWYIRYNLDGNIYDIPGFYSEDFIKDNPSATEIENNLIWDKDNSGRLFFYRPTHSLMLEDLLIDSTYRENLYLFIQQIKKEFVFKNYTQNSIIYWSRARYDGTVNRIIDYNQRGLREKKLVLEKEQAKLKNKIENIDVEFIQQFIMIEVIILLGIVFPLRYFIKAITWALKTLRKKE